MHEVLVNRLECLSLPRKSVVWLTVRPDMTLDVYRGRKITTQPINQKDKTTPPFCAIVGQGPTVLAVGAGGGCLDIFSLTYHFSLLSPPLWETARYRLKYGLKGPLSPKQPTHAVHHNRTQNKN